MTHNIHASELTTGNMRAESDMMAAGSRITYPAIARSTLPSFKQRISNIDANCAELLITVIAQRMKVETKSIRLKRNAEINELFSAWKEQKQWYYKKIPAGMMISYAYKLKIEALDKNGLSLGELPADFAMKIASDEFSTISGSVMALKCFPEIK